MPGTGNRVVGRVSRDLCGARSGGVNGRACRSVSRQSMWMMSLPRGVLMQTSRVFSRRRFSLVVLAIVAAGWASHSSVNYAADPPKKASITEKEVQAAQQAWCDGLVQIGKVYKDGGDYKAAASRFLDELYDFQEGKVFFRPTLAAAPRAFRTTKEGALAYFVGGNPEFPDDKGFALAPWV